MKKSLIWKQLLLAIMILSFASAAFALDFDYNTVATGDSVGLAKDSVCGPDGKIHLSYNIKDGISDDSLEYAVYDGSSWSVETVIVPGDSLSSNTSIALDTSGNPHIVYNYSCNSNEHYQDLDHAWWDGSQWQSENIFDGELASYRPGHPTLAISDSNMMNVVFHVEENMYWATKQLPSGSWVSQDIDGMEGNHTSMALDSNGYPHVSYRSGCWDDDAFLGYSYYNGSSWVHEEVVSGDVHGTCMAFDPSGTPCISFVVGTDGGILYFAYKDGLDWDIEAVDSDGVIMWEFTSLGFTSDGTPFIAYIDEEYTPNTLKLAQRDSDGGWTVTEVDEAGRQSCQLQNTSLVVDNQNYVHTFYNGYNASDDLDADIYHSIADTGIVADDVTNGSSGGGCSVGSFIPLSLLLITPLAFMLKK